MGGQRLPMGRRLTEPGSKRYIDRDGRTRQQRRADTAYWDNFYREAMAEAEANPIPNDHACEARACSCRHSGPCCSACLPF